MSTVSTALWSLGGFWAIMSLVVLLWRGFKQRRWRLGLKGVLAGTVLIVGSLWLVFFMVTAVVVLPGFVAYLEALPLATTGEFVRATVPWFYVLTVIGVLGIMFVRVFTWNPRYTDEEKEFLERESEAWYVRLGPLGRFLRPQKRNVST